MRRAISIIVSPRACEHDWVRLRRPKGVLVDYGGTLVQETGYDPRLGHEFLLSRAAFVPSHITPNDILHRANRVSEEVASRRDEFHLETPWPALTRLIHEFLGIRFSHPLSDLELGFWKASVTTEPIPGAREALEEFQRNQIPVGVVSNCSFQQEVIRHELTKHGLDAPLAFIMVTADYAVRKPNVLLFETAAAKLGIEPRDIWFIGDRLDTDVAGARAAGMQPVWFGSTSGGEATDDILVAPNWPAVMRFFRS